MTQRRGNKTSKAHRAERQAREIEMMNDGKKQSEIVEELGISRQTFWRDLNSLTKSYADGNQQAFAKLREMQVGALLDVARDVHEDKITPEVGNSVRGFLDSVSRILGLNAPTKALVAHTSQPTDVRYLKFKAAADGLDDVQLEEAFNYLRQLPRTPRVTIKDASWFPAPEPKLLNTGDNDEQPS